MKIRPLADRVVIQTDKPEETTKSGIILTNSAQEKPQVATVIAVGPGIKENGEELPISVNVGDKVLTGKYAGTEIKIEDEVYNIVRESDILAIVE